MEFPPPGAGIDLTCRAMEAFLTGVVAGYGIAIPVGVIAVLIVQTGIKRGFRAAFAAGAGAATADLIYATVAVLGGAAIAAAVESLGNGLRWASAVSLAAIAIFGLVGARSPHDPSEGAGPGPRSRSTYFRFLGLTLINPATIVYFAAIVIGLGMAEDLGGGSGARFAAGAFVASLSWQTLLAAFGAGAGHRLSNRARRWAVIGGNLVILALAVVVATG